MHKVWCRTASFTTRQWSIGIEVLPNCLETVKMWAVISWKIWILIVRCMSLYLELPTCQLYPWRWGFANQSFCSIALSVPCCWTAPLEGLCVCLSFWLLKSAHQKVAFSLYNRDTALDTAQHFSAVQFITKYPASLYEKAEHLNCWITSSFLPHYHDTQINNSICL